MAYESAAPVSEQQPDDGKGAKFSQSAHAFPSPCAGR
jgi:hypothetical protein